MKVENILIPTGVAKPGMLMRDVFTECVRAQVPAIPYRDENGDLTGRVSLRNTIKKSCLPEFMVEMAEVLGDQMSCIESADQKARDILCHKVEDFVLPDLYSLTTDTTVIKALAVMEKYNSTYLFIVDDGDYKGVVTILGIARRMIALDLACKIA